MIPRNLRPVALAFFAISIGLFWWCDSGRAADGVPELSQQQLQAIESISESQLQGMVSFLASDELKGRMTPSPELAIASRFVATRLQAAGLKPIAGHDSFFQVHELPQFQLPDHAEITVGGKDVKVRGILAAVPNDVTVEGIVLTEAEGLKHEGNTSPACVILDDLPLPPLGQVGPQFIQSMVARRLAALSKKDVQLVIIKSASGSRLPEIAESLAGHPLSAKKGRSPKCPVLLVGDDEVSAGDEIKASVPASIEANASVRNVFGMIKGSDPQLSATAILVTAHLDHIGTRDFGPDRINNGADDNATGVAAVIAMAEAVAEMETPPKRTLIFGTFWGEEAGLLGSQAYAKSPLWPLDKTVANVNFEMLGRPETNAVGKVWMTGWKHSDLGEIINQGSQRVGVETFDRTDVGEMLYTRSDNASFVKKGVIAHSFSAGSLHSDYHQPTDEWQKLDFPHMTKATQGIFAGLLHLANRVKVPQKR